MRSTFQLSNFAAALAVMAPLASYADVPGDASSTAVLPVGSPIAGEFDKVYDADWFKLPITRGKHYSIVLIPTKDAGFNMRIMDETGRVKLSTGNITGINSAKFAPRYEFTAPVNGFRWIAFKLTSPGLDGSKSQAYMVSVREECANDPHTTCIAAHTGVNIGRSEFLGDSDWWKMHVRAGETYNLRLNAPFSSNQNMQLINRERIVTNQVDDGKITFTSDYTGWYYINASPLSEERNTPYNLYITQPSAAD